MGAQVAQAMDEANDPPTGGAAILRRCIETEADSLRGTLAVYLLRAWPMPQGEAWERANDVLAEVVTIALRKAAEFDPQRSPRAWLLGIGNRVVRQQRDAVFAQRQREAGPRSAPPEAGSPTEAAIFERLAALSSPDVALAVEQAEAVRTLLAPLSPAARQVVSLRFIAGLQGAALAQALQCSPGAARVRLYRAMCELRAAWHAPAGEGSEA